MSIIKNRVSLQNKLIIQDFL